MPSDRVGGPESSFVVDDRNADGRRALLCNHYYIVLPPSLMMFHLVVVVANGDVRASYLVDPHLFVTCTVNQNRILLVLNYSCL